MYIATTIRTSIRLNLARVERKEKAGIGKTYPNCKVSDQKKLQS